MTSPQVVIILVIFFLSDDSEKMIFDLALFLPSIVSQLEFNPNLNNTQLLSVGPFAARFFGECFEKEQCLFLICSSNECIP